MSHFWLVSVAIGAWLTVDSLPLAFALVLPYKRHASWLRELLIMKRPCCYASCGCLELDALTLRGVSPCLVNERCDSLWSCSLASRLPCAARTRLLGIGILRQMSLIDACSIPPKTGPTGPFKIVTWRLWSSPVSRIWTSFGQLLKAK